MDWIPICLINQAKIGTLDAMTKSAMRKPIHDMPSAYLRHLLKLGVSMGISEQDLLRGFSLSPSVIDSVNSRVSTPLVGKITQRLVKLSERHDVGMAYGMLIRPTTHGFLGYAVMSCATFGDAMRVLHKYLASTVSDLTVNMVTVNDDVILTLTENYNLAGMRKIYLEAFIAGSCNTIKFLIGQEILDFKVNVDWPQPDYFDQYQALLPPWQFDQAYTQMIIPKSMLSLPLIMANPDAVQNALALLDKELASRAISQNNDFVPRVRSVLETRTTLPYPSLNEVASILCVSDRTLKRRLKEADTSFQAILDNVRQRQAIELMNAGQLSLQTIALRIGYTDPATFSRAFKRWTGQSPNDWHFRSRK